MALWLGSGDNLSPWHFLILMLAQLIQAVGPRVTSGETWVAGGRSREPEDIERVLTAFSTWAEARTWKISSEL